MHNLKHLHLSGASLLLSVLFVGLSVDPQMSSKPEMALSSTSIRQTFGVQWIFGLPGQNIKAQTLEAQTVEADASSSRRLNFVKFALVGISVSLAVLLMIFLWHTSPRRRMRIVDLKDKADDLSDEEDNF